MCKHSDVIVETGFCHVGVLRVSYREFLRCLVCTEYHFVGHHKIMWKRWYVGGGALVHMLSSPFSLWFTIHIESRSQITNTVCS